MSEVMNVGVMNVGQSYPPMDRRYLFMILMSALVNV